MKLDIISPESSIYSGQSTLVTLPGVQGSFTILENHAPIISPLTKGVVVYEQTGESITLPVDGGFVEAKNNVVTVCVE
ncbi:MAG: ATP synthase F1 subunit epsilon [Candidatus Symbiothrix sp.]|jgi:F-type H+-transporting ATPase subunit epsilon|nr:ATP synthase F1 subunit epsilon [Candidatus Symbiothrix sp.]